MMATMAPMATYKITNDLEEFIEGDTPIDLATALWLGSWRAQVDQTLEDYIIGFAQRRERFGEAVPRTDSPENFIEDLINFGYLEISKNG